MVFLKIAQQQSTKCQANVMNFSDKQIEDVFAYTGIYHAPAAQSTVPEQ